jgi:hypothetical protein
MILRVRLLEPIFQVKWCCIVLNEFLIDSSKRRSFANPGRDINEIKSMQLAKAEKMLSKITLKGKENGLY